jgi:hypothetical protein
MTCRDGGRVPAAAQDCSDARPLQEVLDTEIVPGPQVETTRRCWTTSATAARPCFIRSAPAAWGLTRPRQCRRSPKLRVYGSTTLRVVDASIFPTVTSGNTNAPAIMVGEKGADIILSDHVRNIRTITMRKRPVQFRTSNQRPIGKAPAARFLCRRKLPDEADVLIIGAGYTGLQCRGADGARGPGDACARCGTSRMGLQHAQRRAGLHQPQAVVCHAQAALREALARAAMKKARRRSITCTRFVSEEKIDMRFQGGRPVSRRPQAASLR